MSRGTTIRNVRVADDLWGAALRCADERSTNVSEVIRALLEAWVAGDVTLDDQPL